VVRHALFVATDETVRRLSVREGEESVRRRENPNANERKKVSHLARKRD